MQSAPGPLENYFFLYLNPVHLGLVPDLLTGLQIGMPLNVLLKVSADFGPMISGGLVVPVVAHVFDTVLGNRDRVVASHGKQGVLADVVTPVTRDGDALVVAHGLAAVVANDDDCIVLNTLAAVVSDKCAFVVVDMDVLVLLGMDVDLLPSRLILEAHFIEAFALVRLAFDGHAGLVRRQVVRRQLMRVVASSRDDRLIGIAVEIADDDFLSDAGNGHVAPQRAGHVLRHAYPAGAVFVVLAFSVPRELHLHAAVVVAIDFLARRTDHRRLLRTIHTGFGERRGTPFDIVGYKGGRAVVVRAVLGVGAVFGQAGVLRAVVLDADRPPTAIHAFARMAYEVKGNAGNESRIVAVGDRDACLALKASKAVSGEGHACAIFVAPRVRVALIVGGLMHEAFAFALGVVVVSRIFEVVVALALTRGAHMFRIEKTAKRRPWPVAPRHGVVFDSGAFGPTEHPEAVAVDQAVTLRTVLESEEDPFFAHDALDEVVIAVSRLHAVFPRQMGMGDSLFVGQRDAVFAKHGVGDVGDRHRLEYAPVRTQLQASKTRLDRGAITGPPEAGVALLERRHQTMHETHGMATLPDGEQGGLVQDAAEVDV